MHFVRADAAYKRARVLIGNEIQNAKIELHLPLVPDFLSPCTVVTHLALLCREGSYSWRERSRCTHSGARVWALLIELLGMLNSAPHRPSQSDTRNIIRFATEAATAMEIPRALVSSPAILYPIVISALSPHPYSRTQSPHSLAAPL